jgi:hypothetical protein
MTKRWGTLLFFLAAIWPLLARYFGEFLREFVVYEQASKIIHRLVDQAPVDVSWQLGPSLVFAAIGVFLHLRKEKSPCERATNTPNNPAPIASECDDREWYSSYDIFKLADPKFAKRAADAEEQVAKLAQQIDEKERLLFQLNDQRNALVLLQPTATTKLRIVANCTAASLQMTAMQQQLAAARAKALEDIYEKLKSGKLVARGFRHPIRRHVMEVEIPAAQWRIIHFTGDYSQAQGQGIKYSGIAIAQARRQGRSPWASPSRGSA